MSGRWIFLLAVLAVIAWAPPASAVACNELRSLTGYEFSVISARVVPASADVPEHCRVVGQILPEVMFEVDLPQNWNGRLVMVGNGGYAGEAVDTPARSGTRARLMSRGYAMTATNTGHDGQAEPLGTFAANPQKLVDYAFRAVHVTAMTAKQVLNAYYGRRAERSYFEGCSTGGRQALIEAQRFPQDFDGVVIGAPVLNFSGTMTMYAWMAKALAAAPIPTAKMKALADAVYAKCDAADGLKDGLIDDPRHCDFAPRRDLKTCGAGADAADCFTEGQIAALEAIYAGVKSNGKPFFPGWPVGAEIGGTGSGAGPAISTGWAQWIVRDDGPTISRMFAESFFRNLAFTPRQSDFELTKFDFDKDPARLEAIHRMLDATDTDLAAFRERGGKALMYYGWADPALNPMMGVNYYEDVLKRMGASTPDFFRLFMMPGVFHCSGGVGPDRIDALGALTTWVEKGTVPDRLRAAKLEAGKEVRTRPLCPYPQTAIYKGSGSVDDAANFTCGVRK